MHLLAMNNEFKKLKCSVVAGYATTMVSLTL